MSYETVSGPFSSYESHIPCKDNDDKRDNSGNSYVFLQGMILKVNQIANIATPQLLDAIQSSRLSYFNTEWKIPN